MEGFSDLLSDAFSETSISSFPDEDLDFENLNFDEKFDEDGTENLITEKDGALLQEATGEMAVLFETKEIVESIHEEQSHDKSDEEDFKDVGISVMSMHKTPEEDYTSSDGDSEQEGSVSGEDDDEEEEDVETVEKPGDLLMSVHCSDEFSYSNKENEIFAEGQPLAPEDIENPQVSNEEQGEAESDEDVSYLDRIPECGDEIMTKAVENEKDEQEREEDKAEDSSDTECEGIKIKQEGNVLAQPFEDEVESAYRDDPVEASSEFPCISSQNLTAEVDCEEYVEKMKDFSGDEHQEAGESIADYPSDFSSCEYVEDGRKNQESKSSFLPGGSESSSYAQQNTCMEGAVTAITQMGSAEDSDDKEDGYLYSRDLEMDAERLISLGIADGEQEKGSATPTTCDDGDETSESDSYSSSDDEAHRCVQHLENNKQLVDSQIYVGSSSDERLTSNSRADPADFLSWEFDVLNTNTPLAEYLFNSEDMTDTPPTDVNQHSTEYNSVSDVQQQNPKATSPSYQGSLDDSFFFNTGVGDSGSTEQGQLADDEYEEDRNWEQEQKRIDAFNEFYDNYEKENGREERQIKVQFCADPLSQVIHYETDSDRDSLSSSTDGGEEDLSSAETSDEQRESDITLQTKPARDPPKAQIPESMPDLSNTETCNEKQKCSNMMKLMLKMGLVTVMGLLMFWLATDQGEWLSQVFFF